MCEGIVQVLEEQAPLQQFERVKLVRLEVGALAGVDAAAMEFGFEVVTRGTLAAGARLEIFSVPAQAWCLPCGQTVEVAERFDACPLCGGHQLQVTAGDELRIKELEVE